MATKIKMKTLKVQTIYPAFMGEVNECGIGAPCVFIRLAGCNLRCYEKTRGCLCDTPEALAMTSGEQMSVGDIVQVANQYGIEVSARIVEMIHSEDDKGIVDTPSFTII